MLLPSLFRYPKCLIIFFSSVIKFWPKLNFTRICPTLPHSIVDFTMEECLTGHFNSRPACQFGHFDFVPETPTLVVKSKDKMKEVKALLIRKHGGWKLTKFIKTSGCGKRPQVWSINLERIILFKENYVNTLRIKVVINVDYFQGVLQCLNLKLCILHRFWSHYWKASFHLTQLISWSHSLIKSVSSASTRLHQLKTFKGVTS